MNCDNMGVNLRLEYLNTTKPAIIQFVAKLDRSYEYLVKPILGYLFDKIHENELCMDDNTIFDEKGKIICPEEIVNIEIVNYEKQRGLK